MGTRRKLTVKRRGPYAQLTFYIEAHRGKVWITTFDCPYLSEAILEASQADTLVELIARAAKEAREHGNSSP